jgi:hypothetical protein
MKYATHAINNPHIGEQLRISDDSDASLVTPGEVVTVVQVEYRPQGTFVSVDGRRQFRQFLWCVSGSKS